MFVEIVEIVEIAMRVEMRNDRRNDRQTGEDCRSVVDLYTVPTPGLRKSSSPTGWSVAVCYGEYSFVLLFQRHGVPETQQGRCKVRGREQQELHSCCRMSCRWGMLE
jgi:hypothetical protein